MYGLPSCDLKCANERHLVATCASSVTTKAVVSNWKLFHGTS